MQEEPSIPTGSLPIAVWKLTQGLLGLIHGLFKSKKEAIEMTGGRGGG